MVERASCVAEKFEPTEVETLLAVELKPSRISVKFCTMDTERLERPVEMNCCVIEKLEPDTVERLDQLVEIPLAIKKPTLLTPEYRFWKFESVMTEKLLIDTAVATDKLLVAVDIPVLSSSV